MLSTSDKSNIKGKNWTILDLLQEKHPCGQKVDLKYVVNDLKNRDLPFHSSIFEKINGSEVKRAAMKTNGSHGPSGLDAGEWRRMECKLAIRITTEELNFLNSYNACRVIALVNCAGVRPIDIGEVLRQIIVRSIEKCVKRDLELLEGTYRCALDKRMASSVLSMHSGGAFLKIVLRGSYCLMPGLLLIAWIEIWL